MTETNRRHEYVKNKFTQLIAEIENIKNNKIDEEINERFILTHTLLNNWVSNIWNIDWIINGHTVRVRCDSCDTPPPSPSY